MNGIKYITALILGCCFSITAWTQYGFDTVTVYFDIGIPEVRHDQYEKLDSIIQIAQSQQRKLMIYGYADYLGTSQPNTILADHRASNVYQYFIDNGLNKSFIIQYAGVGQVLKKVEGEHGNQDFRKVDVFIKKTKPDHEPDYVFYSEKSTTGIDIPLGLENNSLKSIAQLDVNQTFVLKNIQFYLARSTVIPQSIPYMNELLEILKAYPNLKVRLEGHVCCLDNTGDSYDMDRGNSRLSYNRAETIYKYLVQNGIAPERLSYEGFGRQYPIHPIEDNDEKALENRRVEVRVIAK